MDAALGALPPGRTGRVLLLDPAATDTFSLYAETIPAWPAAWHVSYCAVLGKRPNSWSVPTDYHANRNGLQIAALLHASNARAVTWLLEWLEDIGAKAAAPPLLSHKPAAHHQREAADGQMPAAAQTAQPQHRVVFTPWISESALRRLAKAGWLKNCSIGLLEPRFHRVSPTLLTLGWVSLTSLSHAFTYQCDYAQALVRALGSLGYAWEEIRALGSFSEKVAEQLASEYVDQHHTERPLEARSAPETRTESEAATATATAGTDAATITCTAHVADTSPTDSTPDSMRDVSRVSATAWQHPRVTRSTLHSYTAASNEVAPDHPYRSVRSSLRHDIGDLLTPRDGVLEPWQLLGHGSLADTTGHHSAHGQDAVDASTKRTAACFRLPDPALRHNGTATACEQQPRGRLVLLDRWLDPITPLLTPITVEGLAYEIYREPFWKRWQSTELQSGTAFQQQLQEHAKRIRSDLHAAALAEASTPAATETTSFRQRAQTICRAPFFEATAKIGEWARQLKRFSETRPDPKEASMDEMTAYVRALRHNQAEQAVVSALLHIVERLSAETFDQAYFRELLSLERDLLTGEAERRSASESVAARLERLLAAVAAAPADSWLADTAVFWRLVLLHGLCTGSDELLDRYPSLLHTAVCCYGLQQLRLDWQALCESDLLAPLTRRLQGLRHGAGFLAASNFDWPLVREVLELTAVEPSVMDAYAGYLPLSAALAVLACDGKRSSRHSAMSPAREPRSKPPGQSADVMERHDEGSNPHVKSVEHQLSDMNATSRMDASLGRSSRSENEASMRHELQTLESDRSLLILRQTPNILRPVRPRGWHHSAFAELCQRALRYRSRPLQRRIPQTPRQRASRSPPSTQSPTPATTECIVVLGGCSPVEAHCIASTVARCRGDACAVQVLSTGLFSSREWLIAAIHDHDRPSWMHPEP